MNRRNRLGRAGLVLTLLVLAATVAGVAASATTAVVPKQLTGKWVQRNVWVMTIKSNGTGWYGHGLGAGDLAISHVTAHRLTLSHFSTPGSSCPRPGTYRWKVANRKLKLTKIHDACKPRVDRFAGTWWRAS